MAYLTFRSVRRVNTPKKPTNSQEFWRVRLRLRPIFSYNIKPCKNIDLELEKYEPNMDQI